MKKISKALALVSVILLLAASMFTSCAGDDDSSDPNPVDYTALKTDIASAKQLANAAVIGTAIGNYPQEAVDTLNAAIATAQSVADKTDATQTQVDTARTDLVAAVNTFRASVITTDELTVTFQTEGNSSTYADGVYTLNIGTATEASVKWANQIFISNPNKKAGVAAGDKVHATITVKSDKAITEFFFKDQFNGAPSYSGIDVGENIPGLEAGVAKTFDLYGVVAGDYNEAESKFVIDLRGNEAGTKLELSDVKVEKMTDYTVSAITVEVSSASVSTGENVTLTTKDQYGFAVEGVEYTITSANPVATLNGNELTAGATAETVTVKAIYGDLTASVDITITAEKDYGKYFQNGKQYGDNDPKSANDYIALWYVADAGWNCGPVVELSNVTASATEYSLTRTTTGSKDWSTQISYRTAPGKYAVSFKVKSTAAGKIAVLPSANASIKTVVDLAADTEKEIKFIAEVATDNGKLMQVNLGASENEILPAGTFTISNFKVENAIAVTVSSVQVVPSATSIVAGGKVNLSATVNNEYALADATFAVTDGTGVTGSKVEGNVLTVGEGAGKVSVTATYEGKTSDAVEITVTAAPTYSAPDLTGYYKKYFVTADTTVTKIDAAADTWGSGSKADKNTDGTYTLTSSDSMWTGVGGCVLAFSGNEGSGFVAGTIAKYDYVVLTLDLAAYELSSGDGNNGINVKVPNPNDNNVGQLSIANNWVKNADGTRTYYAALADYSSTVSLATQVALIAGGKGTLVVKEFYIAAKNDPDAEPATPVTFPYTVPSFTGKGDNGYTTIVKASDIPSDATAVTIVIDNTKCAGSGDWWFCYGDTAWIANVVWTDGVGYKAEITGDNLAKIKAGGLGLIATDGLVCTNAITVSVSKDTPAASGDALPVIPAGNENRKTQIEGAGIWIYLDNTSLGITGANASEIHDASTVSIKDHASGSPVTLSSWEFNDYPTDGKTVRLYAIMPDASHTTIDVDISLKIGTKVYTGTVSFVNGVYQFDYKPTEINVSASATEVKPGDTVTFTVKGTPYDIDITDKCEFVILLGDTTGSTISGKTLTAGSTNGTLTVTAKYGELSKNISITVSAAALPTIMSTSKIEGAGVMIWISKDVVATTPAKEDVTVTGKLATTDADYQNYVSDNLSLNVDQVIDQGAQTYIYFTQPAGFPNGAAITETFVIKWGKVTVNAVFDGNALKSSSVEVAN